MSMPSATQVQSLTFKRTPEAILASAKDIIASTRAVLDAVAAVQHPTFDNVIAPLHQIDHVHKADTLVNSTLHSFGVAADVREASMEFEKQTDVSCLHLV
ncbi:hypothetical protein IWW55_000503 [Coemansia sp. RSA 2706]|nr:hypothetical protein IWW55_000503 [Coemansia sp. RSA 2706]